MKENGAITSFDFTINRVTAGSVRKFLEECVLHRKKFFLPCRIRNRIKLLYVRSKEFEAALSYVEEKMTAIENADRESGKRDHNEQ